MVNQTLREEKLSTAGGAVGPKREKPGNLPRANKPPSLSGPIQTTKGKTTKPTANLHGHLQQNNKKETTDTPHSLPFPSNPKTTKRELQALQTSVLPPTNFNLQEIRVTSPHRPTTTEE
jgi:hypothetical protein